MAEHNEVGKNGEVIAKKYLHEQEFTILETNWRFQKAEIDIIAKDGNELVIVEVKTRTSEEFENPKEAVTLSKQKLIIKAANAYIEEKNIEMECRFDVISILILKSEKKIEHIKNAFIPLI